MDSASNLVPLVVTIGASEKAPGIHFSNVLQWQKPSEMERLKENTLYETCKNICYRIGKDASSATSSKVVYAEDTDMFILALAFKKEIDAKLYLRCGYVMRTRFIGALKLLMSHSKYQQFTDGCYQMTCLRSWRSSSVVCMLRGVGPEFDGSEIRQVIISRL